MSSTDSKQSSATGSSSSSSSSSELKKSPLSLDQLEAKKQQLQTELETIERTIYENETDYLEDTASYGNVVKGWDGFAASKAGVWSKGGAGYGFQMKGGNKRITVKDRIFSHSSATCPHLDEDELAELVDSGLTRRSNRPSSYASRMDEMY